MGETVNKTSGELNEKSTGKSAGDKSTSSTSTKRGNTGAGAGTGAGETEEKKPLRVPLVTEDETEKTVEIEVEAPKQTKKKTTARKKKTTKKKDEGLTASQLNLFVGSIFGIIASRPNMEHWAISEKECNSITTPLANIINNNENMKMIAEHSDAIALAVAGVSVIVPRVIITTQMIKEKKKIARTGQVTNTTVEKGKAESVSAGTSTGTTSNNTGHGSDLSFLSPVSD